MYRTVIPQLQASPRSPDKYPLQPFVPVTRPPTSSLATTGVFSVFECLSGVCLLFSPFVLFLKFKFHM